MTMTHSTIQSTVRASKKLSKLKKTMLGQAVMVASMSFQASSALAGMCPSSVTGAITNSCNLNGTMETTIQSGGSIYSGPIMVPSTTGADDEAIKIFSSENQGEGKLLTVVNFGKVIGGTAGIHSVDDFDGRIKNKSNGVGYVPGFIYGTQYGIQIDGHFRMGDVSGDNNKIINAGIISAGTKAFSTSHAYVLSQVTSSIPSATGVYIRDDLQKGAALINRSTGQILANALTEEYNAYAYGVRIAGDGIYHHSNGNLDGTIINEKGGRITVNAIAPGSSSYGYYAQAYGIYINKNLNGELLNDGRIEVTAAGYASGPMPSESSRPPLPLPYDAYATGIYMGLDLVGRLANTGIVVATADVGGTPLLHQGPGQFAQARAVYTGGDLVSDETFFNSGMMNAYATGGVGGASATGYHLAGDVLGSFVNSGQLEGNAAIIDVLVHPADSASIRAYGVRIGGDIVSTLNNSGNINGNAGLDTELLNITGTTGVDLIHAYGIKTSDIFGALLNSGEITATANHHPNPYNESSDHEVAAFGVKFDELKTGGLIENSGEVDSTADNFDFKDGTAVAAGILMRNLEVDALLDNTLDGKVLVDARGHEALAMGIGVLPEPSNVGFFNQGMVNGDSGVFEGVIRNAGLVRARADADQFAVGLGVNLQEFEGQLFNTETGAIRARARVLPDYSQYYESYVGFAFGVYTEGDFEGILTNGGLIKARAHILSDAYGYGSEPVLALAHGVHFDHDYNGELINTVTGSIVGDASIASHTYPYYYYADTGSEEVEVVEQSFEQTGSSFIFADGIGIYTDYEDIRGYILNEGHVEGIASIEIGVPGVVAPQSMSGGLNAQTSSSYGYLWAAARGIHSAGSVDGKITNTTSGSIIANAMIDVVNFDLWHALESGHDGHDVYYGYGGIYLADAAGIAIENTLNGNIDNAGLIQGNANIDLFGLSGLDYAARAHGVLINDDIDGDLFNREGGRIEANAYVDAFFAGNLSYVSAHAAGVELHEGDIEGLLVNAGKIEANANIGFSTARRRIMPDNWKETVYQINGVMYGDFYPNAYGIYIDGSNSGDLINEKTGSIVANAHADIFAGYAMTYGSFMPSAYGIGIGRDLDHHIINRGFIQANGSAYIGASYYGGGSYSYIHPYAHGIAVGKIDGEWDEGDLNGHLVNLGTIEANALVEVAGDGYHEDVAADAYGVFVADEVNGGICNGVGGDLCAHLNEFNSEAKIVANATMNLNYGYGNDYYVNAYGIYIDGQLSGAGGIINHAAIEGHAIINIGAHYGYSYSGNDFGALARGIQINGEVTGHHEIEHTLQNNGLILANALINVLGGYTYNDLFTDAIGLDIQSELSGTVHNDTDGLIHAFANHLGAAGTASAIGVNIDSSSIIMAADVGSDEQSLGMTNITANGRFINRGEVLAVVGDKHFKGYGTAIGFRLIGEHRGEFTNFGTITAHGKGAYLYVDGAHFSGPLLDFSDWTNHGLIEAKGTVVGYSSSSNFNGFAMVRGVHVNDYEVESLMHNTTTGTILATAHANNPSKKHHTPYHTGNADIGGGQYTGQYYGSCEYVDACAIALDIEGYLQGDVRNDGLMRAEASASGGYVSSVAEARGVSVYLVEETGKIVNNSFDSIWALAKTPEHSSDGVLGIGRATGIHVDHHQGLIVNRGLVAAQAWGDNFTARSLNLRDGYGIVRNKEDAMLSGGVFAASDIHIFNDGRIRVTPGDVAEFNGDNYTQSVTGVAGVVVNGWEPEHFGRWNIDGTLDLSNGSLEVLVTSLTSGDFSLDNVFSADTLITNNTIQLWQFNDPFSFWDVAPLNDGNNHIDLVFTSKSEVTLPEGAVADADIVTGKALYVPDQGTLNLHGGVRGDVAIAGRLDILGDEAFIIGDVLGEGAEKGYIMGHYGYPEKEKGKKGKAGVGGLVNVFGNFTSGGEFHVGNIFVAESGVFNQKHLVTSDVSVNGTWNPVGSQIIEGDLTLGDAGRLQLTLFDTDSYDQLSVWGTANLSESSLLDIRLAPGARIALGDLFDDVLIADTLITTDNDEVAFKNTLSHSHLLDFRVVNRGDNRFDLLAVIGDHAVEALVQRDNVSHLKGQAKALDEIIRRIEQNPSSISEELRELIASLGPLTTDELVKAMREMSPTLNAQSRKAVLLASHDVNKAVLTRAEVQRSAGTIGPGPGGSAGDPGSMTGSHVWVKPFGSWGSQDGEDSIPGYDIDTAGIAVGADTQASDTLLVGIAAAYSWADIEENGGPDKIEVKGGQVGVYASLTPTDRDFINLIAAVGWNDNDSRRRVTMEMETETLKASYDSWFARLYAGIGHDFMAADNVTLTPVLSLGYTYIDEDDYTETGGATAFKGEPDSDDSLILALDGIATFDLDANNQYVLKIRAGVGYDFLNGDAVIATSFTGGGPVFDTTGIEPSPWLYRAGVGLEIAATETLDIYFDYDYEARGSDFDNHILSATARLAF